jgi:hypothetical protein
MTSTRLALGVLAACACLAAVPAVAATIRPGFDGSTLPRNDDGSTGLVALGFTANFFGTSYSQAYVNNNGNVTFDDALSTYTPFGLQGTSRVIIAPFFADVDTSEAGNPTRYGTGTVDGRAAFGVNWLDVDYYSGSTTHTNRNSFQLVLVERADTGAGNFDFEFNYGGIQWESGEASGSDENGRGGSCARAGYSNGSSVSFEIAGSGVCGAFLDGGPSALVSGSNVNEPGRWLFQVRNGQVVTPPPPPPPGPTPVPEPATLLLLGAGLAGLTVARRRR